MCSTRLTNSLKRGPPLHTLAHQNHLRHCFQNSFLLSQNQTLQDSNLQAIPVDPLAGTTPAKVRITTYIGSDVLGELKKRAITLGIPYQTLLNVQLRQSVSPEAKAPSFEN